MPPPTPSPDAVRRLRDTLEELRLSRNPKPTIKQIADALHLRERAWSPATVDRILKCDPCPKLDQLLAVVSVLAGDEAEFRQLWNDIHGLRSGRPREQPVERGQCIGQLTSPLADATVGTRTRVEGVVQALPQRHHVWIAHQVDPGGLFWAKDFEVILDGDGRFERTVYEGGSARDFLVLLLLTSEAGHAQLTEWMTECSRSGSYPGIPPAPSRFVELDRVAVRFDPSAT